MKEEHSLPRALRVLLVVLYILCCSQGFGQHNRSNLPTTTAALSTIEDLKLGQRVRTAVDGEVQISTSRVEPEQWRMVELLLHRGDDDVVHAEVLRSTDWLLAVQAAVMSRIRIDLDKIGFSGFATVLSINPSPVIEPGEGRVITGSFRHFSDEVLEIRLEGAEDALRATPSHPFFSEDRAAYVPAGSLREGERLRLLDGRTPRIESICQLAGLHPVFNIEVEGEHRYFVGEDGVLVHNSRSLMRFAE